MRFGPLVLLALIALLAPAQTHAQVAAPPAPPTPSVQTVEFQRMVFSTLTAPTARPSARPDDVVARMMSFDRDNSGTIEKSELAERMYTVMDRGDANGDGCLDRTELLAMTRAKPVAAVRGFGHGSYALGPDTQVSSRQHLEGAIDDLRLDAARKQPALAIVTTFTQKLDTGAQAELLDAMQAILTPEQLTSFTKALESERSGSMQKMMTLTSNEQQVKSVRVFGGALAEGSLRSFRLAPEVSGRALAALKAYRTRLRPNEADRVELGRQLTSVLTREESENFLAAIARQPVSVAGGAFAFKQVVDSDVVVGGAPANVVKR